MTGAEFFLLYDAGDAHLSASGNGDRFNRHNRAFVTAVYSQTVQGWLDAAQIEYTEAAQAILGDN